MSSARFHNDNCPVPPATPHFRSDIEGLRGIAILLVVLFHARVPGFAGGFIGVDVFFTLSGYLITALLVREFEASGGISLRNFYARRVRRLLPACVLVVLVTLLASVLVLGPLELVRVAQGAAATALYVSNFWFMHAAGDYFAADSKLHPLLHTWSLAVEEQFYVVWPLIVLLALRRSRRTLIWTVAAVTFVSFVACIVGTVADQRVAFYGSPLRAWEFGAGALVSLIPASRVRSAAVLGGLGLAGIVTTGVVTPQAGFPGLYAAGPVIATAAALMAGASAPARGYIRILNSTPLQFVGRLSYSWYLWHWPVLILTATMVDLTLPGRLLCMVASLGFAWAAHHLVENPIRFSRTLVASRALSLGLAGIVTVVTASIGIAVVGMGQAISLTPAYSAYTEAAADRQLLGQAGCIASARQSTLLECTFGDTASETTVVLFGDSHAAQWFPALEQTAAENGWRIVTLVKMACPVPAVKIYSVPLAREHWECDEWRRLALQRVAAIRPQAVLVSTSKIALLRMIAAGYDGQSEEVLEVVLAETTLLRLWERGMRTTLQALHEHSSAVILLRDTPLMGFDVPVCLSRSARRKLTDDPCWREASSALAPQLFAAEARAAHGIASVVDMNDVICSSKVCRATNGGLVVFRDSHHLSTRFVRSIAPDFGSRVDNAMQ